MHGNRMGPEEKGPKTGRGLGYCSGNDHPGYMSPDFPQGNQRGYGRRGGGFGRRCGGRGYGGFGGRGFGFSESELLSRIESLEKTIAELKK